MTRRAVAGGRGAVVAAMAAGAAIAVVGSLLPWVRTGDARRNSYDLFSLIDRLGFAPDGPAEPALRWWPMMPLLATLAVVAAAWRWPRAGGTAGFLAAGYAAAVGVAVADPPSELVDAQPGTVVTVAGAAVLAAASVAAVITGRRPVRPTGPDSPAPSGARPDGPS